MDCDNSLDEMVLCKPPRMRVYNKDGRTMAVNLDTGMHMVFSDIEKAVFSCCRGIDSCTCAAEALNLNYEEALPVFERLVRCSMLIPAGEDISEMIVPGCGPAVKFDMLLWNEAEEEELAGRWIAAGAELMHRQPLSSDKNRCGCSGSENGGNRLYQQAAVNFSGADLQIHSKFILRILRGWAAEWNACCDKEPAAAGGFKAVFPLRVVVELQKLPEFSDMLSDSGPARGEQGVLGELELSDAGILWCWLHRAEAEIIVPFTCSELACCCAGGEAERRYLDLRCLVPASKARRTAETADMLYNTALKYWKVPPAHAGHYPMRGLSILPVLIVKDKGELLPGLHRLAENGYSSAGFRLSREILEKEPSWLNEELSCLLEEYGLSMGLRGMCVYPLQRFEDDVLGIWPRCRLMEEVFAEPAVKGAVKPKCRRCAAWHFCWSAPGGPPLPCSFIHKECESVLWSASCLPVPAGV